LAAIHTQLTGPDWSEGLLLNLYLWSLYVLAFLSLASMYVHKASNHKHKVAMPLQMNQCS